SWSEPSLLYLDPRTKQSETEVQKIMHLQEIANQLPDAFTSIKKVTKSHIPAANAPARVEIPNKQAGDNITQESQKHLKCGRPIGSKNKNPHKRKGTKKNSDHDENVLNETQDIKTSPEEEMNDINKKIDIMSGDDYPEPMSVINCQSRPDWDKWKDAMQAELNSLNKRKVFGPIVTTPRDVKPKTTSGFIIIVVYVDDLNIIGTGKEINEVIVHLKEEFEMKDLAKSLRTLMVGRSLNVDNDPFRPCEEDEDVLGPETPYLSAIGALMHWNGIKHTFLYLHGTTDLGLFYSNNSKQGSIGYADASYLSDPHKARSQTGYVFLNGGTAISWRSQKQTLVATSSNHAEVITLHEASRECVWLRSMTQLIVTSCGLKK
ncbi:hypothetical protein Tco_1364981, partial [Tanacetum coccineum]